MDLGEGGAPSSLTTSVENDFENEEREIQHTEKNPLTSLDADGFPELSTTATSEGYLTADEWEMGPSSRSGEDWSALREVLSEPGESPLSPLGSEGTIQEDDAPAQIDWKTSGIGTSQESSDTTSEKY
ncbi:MAG: hypothetical protein EBQ85_01320 [Proteobacteria bacterium]|nr:hypothetical protein [Pseudomonadota bacterium]